MSKRQRPPQSKGDGGGLGPIEYRCWLVDMRRYWAAGTRGMAVICDATPPYGDHSGLSPLRSGRDNRREPPSLKSVVPLR